MLKVSIFCLEIKFTFSISVVDSQGFQLKKACGEKAGMSYYSFYPLTINFHSDSSVSKRGFNATWTKSTDVTGGNIKSPNFPNLYENLGHQVRSQKQFNYFSNSVSRYGSCKLKVVFKSNLFLKALILRHILLVIMIMWKWPIQAAERQLLQTNFVDLPFQKLSSVLPTAWLLNLSLIILSQSLDFLQFGQDIMKTFGPMNLTPLMWFLQFNLDAWFYNM